MNLEKDKFYIVHSDMHYPICARFIDVNDLVAEFINCQGDTVICALRDLTGTFSDYEISPALISTFCAFKLTGMFITSSKLTAHEVSKKFKCNIEVDKPFLIHNGKIALWEDYFNNYMEYSGMNIPLYTLDNTGYIVDVTSIIQDSTNIINRPVILFNPTTNEACLRILCKSNDYWYSCRNISYNNLFSSFHKDTWSITYATLQNVVRFKVSDVYLKISSQSQLETLCALMEADINDYNLLDLDKNAFAILHKGKIKKIITDDTIVLDKSMELFYKNTVMCTNLTIDTCGNIILMNNKEEKKMKSNKYIDKVVALYSDNKHIGYGLLVDENEKEFKLQFEPIHKTATYNKNSYEYRPASVYYIKDRHESICFTFKATKHNLDILKSCWKTFEAFNIKEDNNVHYLMVKNGLCLYLPNDSRTQLVMNRYGYLDYIDLYKTHDTFVTKSYLTSLKDDINELSKFDIANFHTTEGVRYESDKQYKDFRGGKQINTITTHISYKGKEATATIDANDYDERQGILEACANLVFDNFDSEYEKYLKKKKQLADKEKVCTICGKKFETVEEAHKCVEKHNESKERKEQRYQEYLLRKEAHKKYNELKHEEQVNDYIKKLYEKENKTENTNND